MFRWMMAHVKKSDEVIVFEPFYENYGPDAILSGATPRYVTLHTPDWRIDPADFFFQAEDGIRDADVTEVQTCALPIFLAAGLLPDARITIYPDSAHGFLFQHHER